MNKPAARRTADHRAITNALFIQFLESGRRGHEVSVIANLMGWSETKVRGLLKDVPPLLVSSVFTNCAREYRVSDAYLRDELLRLRAMEAGVMARDSMRSRGWGHGGMSLTTKAATPQNEEQTKALLEASLKRGEETYVWVDSSNILHRYDSAHKDDGPELENCNDRELIESSEAVEDDTCGVVVAAKGVDGHYHFVRHITRLEGQHLGVM